MVMCLFIGSRGTVVLVAAAAVAEGAEEPEAVVAGAAADFGFTTLLTSQVVSVAFCSAREKSDKFSSDTLISA